MVCDENSAEPRLPYNNIYNQGTRPSQSDANSTENGDYSRNIESVEAATNAGSSAYLQNGEPPQVEEKRNVPRKVPTRYVLVVMGFLAFVNMYMMYLNITVAWPAMVDHNVTKLGPFDDQKGVFFDTSDMEADVGIQEPPIPNAQLKKSHRKETHKQRKVKRKTEPFVIEENLTSKQNSSRIKEKESVNYQSNKHIIPTKPIKYSNEYHGLPNITQVTEKNVVHNATIVNMPTELLSVQTTLVKETDALETTTPLRPIETTTKELPQKLERKHKKVQIKGSNKKIKRKRRSTSTKQNAKNIGNVQVISILPKVVIKSISRQNTSTTTSTNNTTTPLPAHTAHLTDSSTYSSYQLAENITETPATSAIDVTELESQTISSQNDSNEISTSNSLTEMPKHNNSKVTTLPESHLVSEEDATKISTTISTLESGNHGLAPQSVGTTEKSSGSIFSETTLLTTSTTITSIPASSVTTENSTQSRIVIDDLFEMPNNLSLDESKAFIEAKLGVTISAPIFGNTTNISSLSNRTNVGVNENNATLSGTILPIVAQSNKAVMSNLYALRCLTNPKSCEPRAIKDLIRNVAMPNNLQYHINSHIPPPIGPPFTVRNKKDKAQNKASEEESDESDEYSIKQITFNFGNQQQVNNCNGTNCANNMNIVSMSIFYDHSSSSSSSSEEDDDEEESEEEDDDDEEEGEGGEEEDDEDEAEEEHEDDDNEHSEWEDEGNPDDIQLQELYFDNSVNLFKRYDQNATGTEIDSEYIDRADPSNSKISANWVDELKYEGDLCEASSEECEENAEDENADKPTEAEAKEEEEGADQEESIPHRTEGLITLDNEKIPSTVCFYKRKASPTFDGYSEGEFAWEPERLREVTSAYYWGFLFSQIIAGRLSSQFGGKIVMVQAILFAGIITLLTPLLAKAGVYWLLTGRLFLGVMLGLVMPSMHALLAKWAPPLERTKMVAYTYSGIAIGAAIGGPLSAYLVQGVGWRLLFYGQGIIAIVWCILFLLIIYESPNKHKRITPKEKQYILAAIGQQHSGKGLPVPWCNIIRCRHVFSLMLAQGAFVWAWHTLLHYAPLYIASVLHEDLADVQKVWAAALCCMFVSACVYATIADWARKSRKASTITVRRTTNSICSLITAVFLVGVAQSYCNTEAVKVCFALAIAVGLPGALCGIFPNSLDLAPNHAAAIAGISGAFATTANLLAPYYWQLIVLGQSTLERWRTIWYTSAIFLLLANCLYFLLVGAREQRWNRPIVVTKQPRRGEEPTAARRAAYAPYKNPAYVSTEHL